MENPISNPTPTIKLSAFVGRSFLPEDDEVWLEVREVLEAFRPMGFAFADAKPAEAMPISEKVERGLKRHDVYIAILTKREQLILKSQENSSWPVRLKRWLLRESHPKKWTTSDWLMQEIGFARAANKVVIKIIEDGVRSPATDLTADGEYIGFSRDNLKAINLRLTQMIVNLLAKAEQKPVDPENRDVPPEQRPDEPHQAEPSFSDQIDAITQLYRDGQTSEADDLQQSYLDKIDDPEFQNVFLSFALSSRAIVGDTSALEKLTSLAKAADSHWFVLQQLTRYYTTLGQPDEAIRILYGELSARPKSSSTIRPLTLSLARLLVQQSRKEEAYRLLKNQFAQIGDDGKDATWALAEMASVAHDMGNEELSCNALEAVLVQQPNSHDLRFDLAYRYAEIGNSRMAAYHYRILLRADWSADMVRNNLAIEYQKLGWTLAHVELLEQAQDSNPLAKANLAWTYFEAGFVAEGKKLATEVMTADSDNERALARARALLDGIGTAQQEETKGIDALATEITDERQFRAEYGSLLGITEAPTVFGKYQTNYGQLDITVTGGVLNGVGTDSAPNTGLRGSAASLLGLSGWGPPPSPQIRKTTLTGTLTGRTGTFDLAERVGYPEGLEAMRPRRSVQGLVLVREDGELRFLEVDEGKARIMKAQRIV